MEQPKRQPRCLIAAGGTAGHVLPALAVAEALTARGAAVSFAGSPDRVEARLVPEAGFELDTFRAAGLPRRPGPALLRALWLDARALRACGRILEARRAAGGGPPLLRAAGRGARARSLRRARRRPQPERGSGRGLRRIGAGRPPPVRRARLRGAAREDLAAGLPAASFDRALRRRAR